MELVLNLCDVALKNDVITDDVLLANGFTKHDIEELIARHYIIFDASNKKYVFKNTNAFMAYFYKCSSPDKRNYMLRDSILDLMLKYFPGDEEALLNKTFIKIKLGDNKGALDCYSKYYNQKNERTESDILNLYLLSKLINVGDLCHDINGLNINDFKDNNRYVQTARKLIFRKEYEKALECVRVGVLKDGLTKLEDLLTKTLLQRIIDVYKDGRNYKECIIDDRFDDALYSINLKKQPNHYESLIKSLLNMINYPDAYNIYNVQNHKDGLWDAIYANDFEYALERSEAYNKDKNIDNESSALTLSLRKLVSMTKKDEIDENLDESNDFYYYDDTDDKYNYVYYISELIGEGLSFVDALTQADLSYYDKGFVTLIYAQEAFRTKHEDLGYYFIDLFKKEFNCVKNNEDLMMKIIYSRSELPNQESELSKTLNMPNISSNK